MADYYTRFSVMLPLGNPERIEPALAIYRKLAEDLDRDEDVSIGFSAAAAPDVDPAALWLSAEEDGNPEHVIAFVQLCGEAFGLAGRWGFRWALTCSRMRLDGWGGGAHVLDLATGETIEWLDCEDWLATRLAGTPVAAATAIEPSRVSVFGVAAAERLLRETAENHRAMMAAEPGLVRGINGDAAGVAEVADALGALLQHHGGAITLQA